MKRRLPCLLLLACLAPTAAAVAGSIKAEVEPEAPIVRVAAVQWVRTPTGMQSKSYEGSLEGGKLLIENLPEEGHYNLRFEFESGGVLEGWDARVPESDYVEEVPLSDADRRALTEKMSQGFAIDFFDEARILDIQGNVQNAAVLLTGHRERPFAEGSGTTHGVWVWRAERWQWENPDERAWVSYPEKPYYAMHRERMPPKGYPAKRVTFARHLGGIELTKDKPAWDGGKLTLPAPRPGIHTIEPDGTLTEPIVLKPRPTEAPATQPAGEMEGRDE